jgi:TolB protein
MVYVMNDDGTGIRRLTSDPALDHSPAWSSDGKRIAFVSDRARNYDIYVMNVDGTNLRGETTHG